ncbi:MAG TPA: hypothetical protein VMS53_04900 [Burkholderiales bacterium]|nr:hypothetical protein [Burkholderiales bacterium]
MALAFVCSNAWAACESPEPVGLQGKTIQDIKPRIAWQPVKGATGYRVRLLSRVPDGRVVVSQDTLVTSPDFLAPQALADQRAKVVVRVNAVCDGETSAERVSTFFIDATSACVMREISAAGAVKTSVDWKPVEGAVRYEVRAYGVVDGQLLVSQETRTPGAQVDLKGQSAVVSVRPACAGVIGEAVYRVVAAR